jgi:hypothetical protein
MVKLAENEPARGADFITSRATGSAAKSNPEVADGGVTKKSVALRMPGSAESPGI